MFIDFPMVVSLQLGRDEAGLSNFEQDPTGMRCGIKIRNLTKEYKVCMYVCVCVCVCPFNNRDNGNIYI